MSETEWLHRVHAAYRRGELPLGTCRACGRASFPPLTRCPHCSAESVDLGISPGAGFLYSWIVVHRALDPEFEGREPYIVGLIELDEGPRLVATLSDASPAIGARVVFDPVGTSASMRPEFRLMPAPIGASATGERPGATVAS